MARTILTSFSYESSAQTPRKRDPHWELVVAAVLLSVMKVLADWRWSKILDEIRHSNHRSMDCEVLYQR